MPTPKPPDSLPVTKIAPPGSALYTAKRGDSVIAVARHYLPQTSYLTSSEVAEAIRQANGIGCFDRRGFPDAVWAGVAPHDEVKALHNKIDAALRRVGVSPDERAFLPHITIARMSRNAGPIGNLLEEAGGLTSPSFTVDSFALFESDLTHEAAVYSIVERYPLA